MARHREDLAGLAVQHVQLVVVVQLLQHPRIARQGARSTGRRAGVQAVRAHQASIRHRLREHGHMVRTMHTYMHVCVAGAEEHACPSAALPKAKAVQ